MPQKKRTTVSSKGPQDLEEIISEGHEDADFGAISFSSVEEIERSIVDSPFRAIYQTNNFLLPQIKDVIDEKRTVNLRPEYQRRARWTNKQKSLLIESFVLNIPVPPIFLFEGDFARYEVMDGQQRLLAIKEFFSNQFPLSSLSILAPLNGLTYDGLPPRSKRTIERASLSAIVLLKESRSTLRDSTTSRVLELRKFVFERLNTGGKQLNAQEIRNAVYSGPFNDLVIELTRHKDFTSAWGIPAYSKMYSESDYEDPERKRNRLYSSMGDAQVVLRFFALRDEDNIRGSMRSILDRCMESNLIIESSGISNFRKDYLSRFRLAMDIFNNEPFRLPKSDRPSESLYDAVMAAIDRLWSRKDEMLKAKIKIKRAYALALAKEDGFSKYTGRANTASDIKNRMKAMTALFRKAMKNA